MQIRQNALCKGAADNVCQIELPFQTSSFELTMPVLYVTCQSEYIFFLSH